MTIERVIHTGEGKTGALIAGLAWRPPTGGKPSRSALHEAKALTAASAFALANAGTHSVYGLFQPRPSEEDQELPKGALSAAAVFALNVGAQDPNAALILRIAGADENAVKFYLVVLEDGLPAIDLLASETDIFRALGDDDRPMWSDNPVRFPHSTDASVEWLAEIARQVETKSAAISKFPVNPWPALIGAVVLASAASGWLVWTAHKDAEAKRLALIEAAAADPVPKYLSALSIRGATAISNRTEIVAATKAIFAISAFVPGWQLRSVECNVAAQNCDSAWIRRGGRYEELRAAMPDQTLVGSQGDTPTPPNFDNAIMRRKLTVSRQALPQKLPSYNEAISSAGNLFQRWKTAELFIDLKPPVLWPTVAGVPASLRPPAAVSRGDFVVTDVPGPFVLEALTTAPAWLSWDTVRVEVADPGSLESARSQLKFSLSGTYYVSTN